MSGASQCTASSDKVKKQINKAFDKLYHVTASGDPVPFVCLVCDEFLKPREMTILKMEQLKECSNILQPGGWNNIDPYSSLAINYSYIGNCSNSYNDTDMVWMTELMLSPRGCYI